MWRGSHESNCILIVIKIFLIEKSLKNSKKLSKNVNFNIILYHILILFQIIGTLNTIRLSIRLLLQIYFDIFYETRSIVMPCFIRKIVFGLYEFAFVNVLNCELIAVRQI